MRKLLPALVLIGSTAIVAPGESRAVDYELVVDTPRQLSSVNGAADTVNVFLFTNRSYCCSTSAENAIGVRLGAPSSTGPFTVTSRGKDDAPTTRSALVASVDTTKCLYTTANTTPATQSVFFTMLIGGGGNSVGTNVIAICEETSLFGGYNTSVTDFNFLEINVSNSTFAGGGVGGTTVNGTVLLRDVVNGVSYQVPFTVTTDAVTGLGRKDIDIHTLVGNKSFGPVIINHDGPPGAVAARVVQYNITSQNPLDFVPVLEQQFVARGKRR